MCIEMRREREREKRICSLEVITSYTHISGKKMTEVLFSIRDSKAKNKEIAIGYKSARHTRFIVRLQNILLKW